MTEWGHPINALEFQLRKAEELLPDLKEAAEAAQLRYDDGIAKRDAHAAALRVLKDAAEAEGREVEYSPADGEQASFGPGTRVWDEGLQQRGTVVQRDDLKPAFTAVVWDKDVAEHRAWTDQTNIVPTEKLERLHGEAPARFHKGRILRVGTHWRAPYGKGKADVTLIKYLGNERWETRTRGVANEKIVCNESDLS
ncbi:hypothetical protein SEA_OTTAWA_34 [Arthrobacter phage Ottawa]|nr:hypothetical protein SEA_KHARCHO_34 [Arthrobacter phage Kharcho]WIC89266.1 hypothetical protein SEA_OTTAWA_34 [Arthrobacter phage Ottawa]